nr:MAG TPA: hemolysin [Crassvirales sp.]
MVKEKELSSADKCRRTKLRKKSVDELVDIILRKDDVERRLSKSVETFKKLQLTNEKRIEILKDFLDKSEEIQSNQEKTICSLNTTLSNKTTTISTLEEHNKSLYGRIDVLEKTIKARNKEARILFAIIVALIISIIILFFI